MSKATVLIVEDEQVLQDVYKLLLDKEGYKVFTASNGYQGLQQLPKVKPDVVLLDLFMPVMDGREFLRNFNPKKYPDTRIAVCTNMSDSNTKQEMLDLGADKFVLKSDLGPKDIISLVQSLLD